MDGSTVEFEIEPPPPSSSLLLLPPPPPPPLVQLMGACVDVLVQEHRATIVAECPKLIATNEVQSTCKIHPFKKFLWCKPSPYFSIAQYVAYNNTVVVVPQVFVHVLLFFLSSLFLLSSFFFPLPWQS